MHADAHRQLQFPITAQSQRITGPLKFYATITVVTLCPGTLVSFFGWFARCFKQRLSHAPSPKRYISPIKTFNLAHSIFNHPSPARPRIPNSESGPSIILPNHGRCFAHLAESNETIARATNRNMDVPEPGSSRYISSPNSLTTSLAPSSCRPPISAHLLTTFVYHRNRSFPSSRSLLSSPTPHGPCCLHIFPVSYDYIKRRISVKRSRGLVPLGLCR